MTTIKDDKDDMKGKRWLPAEEFYLATTINDGTFKLEHAIEFLKRTRTAIICRLFQMHDMGLVSDLVFTHISPFSRIKPKHRLAVIKPMYLSLTEEEKDQFCDWLNNLA